MKRLLLALPLAVLTACGGSNSAPDKDVLMTCDFDTLMGWLPDPTVLNKEKAHSGTYSLKVDASREYSTGYSALLGQLSSSRIRGVRVDGWAYLTDKNSGAHIAVVVKDAAGGKDLAINYVDYNQVTTYGKWQKVSKEIIFPAAANYSSQILIYFWRGEASSPAYLDDLQLTALR